MGRGSHTVAVFGSLLVATLGEPSAAAEDAERSLEIQVKAEFVERFTRFVEWPAAALPAGGAPFVVCTVGQGALSTRLAEVMARGGPGGRPVELRAPGPGAPLDGCHLVYVSGEGRGKLDEVVSRLRGKPILSVGDSPGFARRGLVINLYVDEGGFVRFEINQEAALASGLRYSARLMSLARLVAGRG